MKQDFLHKRTAIVTGAGGGLGRGIALALAGAGANVVIAARRLETGEETANLIHAEGGTSLVVRCDVGKRGNVDAAIAKTTERFGGLDIAIHNANSGSASGSVSLENFEEENFDEQASVALSAALYLAQASYPHLKKSDMASFVLLSSSRGLMGSAMNGVYSATKAAQRGFMKSLAREWGPDQITVNAIAPAGLSDGTAKYFAANPGARAHVENTFPLRRMGRPREDIGESIVALVGPGFRYVTGQTINVSGGTYMAL